MSTQTIPTFPPDLDSYRGRSGYLSIDGLGFAVLVTEARMRFGHLDFHISPAEGRGSKWVESHRIDLA